MVAASLASRVGAALLALALASVARADELVVLEAVRGGAPLDGRRLEEALRIYTHDLGLAWRAGPTPSPHATCWYAAHATDGGVRVELVFVPRDGKTLTLTVEGAAGDDLYRTLALKLRGLLVAAPAPAAATATTLTRAQAPPLVAPPATGPPATPAATTPTETSSLRGALMVGYLASTSERLDGLRSAALLGATLVAGRRDDSPLAVELGVEAEVGARPAATVAGGNAAATLVPLRLVTGVGFRRGALAGAVAARIGVLVIDADATSAAGQHGDALRATALFGGEARVDYALTRRLAVCALVGLDAYVPHERFLVRGAVALDPGGLAFGLGIGLRVGLP